MGRFFIPKEHQSQGFRVDSALRGSRRFLEVMGFLPPRLDGTHCILHVSDTPSSTYGYLRRSLWTIRPMMVIHTGDVADEVKIGLWPSMVQEYRRKIIKLAKALEDTAGWCKLVITCGNHDDQRILTEAMPWAEVYLTRAVIPINGRTVAASHKHSDLGEMGDVNLFGHDLEMLTSVEGPRIMLNGIERMNLVNTADWSVRFIRYPPGTDGERTLRRKRGL